MTDTQTPQVQQECAFPGCDRPAERAVGPGRPPKYCENREHNAQTAFRVRQGRPAGGPSGEQPDLGRPVTMAGDTAAGSVKVIERLSRELVDALGRHAEAM